jgi:hypothetical protein
LWPERDYAGFAALDLESITWPTDDGWRGRSGHAVRAQLKGGRDSRGDCKREGTIRVDRNAFRFLVLILTPTLAPAYEDGIRK